MSASGEPDLPRYEIRALVDLLLVPTDRRSACLRQLEYALALHEFAVGEAGAPGTTDFELVWTDDGCSDVFLEVNGEPLLTLTVTDAPPP